MEGSSDKNDEQLIVEAAHHATVYHSSISVTVSTRTTNKPSHHHEVEATKVEVPPSGTAEHAYEQFSFWNLSISQRVEVRTNLLHWPAKYNDIVFMPLSCVTGSI